MFCQQPAGVRVGSRVQRHESVGGARQRNCGNGGIVLLRSRCGLLGCRNRVYVVDSQAVMHDFLREKYAKASQELARLQRDIRAQKQLSVCVTNIAHAVVLFISCQACVVVVWMSTIAEAEAGDTR
jgi:hypothetical protein